MLPQGKKKKKSRIKQPDGWPAHRLEQGDADGSVLLLPWEEGQGLSKSGAPELAEQQQGADPAAAPAWSWRHGARGPFLEQPAHDSRGSCQRLLLINHLVCLPPA